ncbi:hypothetical protein [Persicitalea jodogahamensis]|uniref:Uncharacterized protein n=1 Tax=Persicitalea jodogahamensis TaxID=402147 RepID=A0A8J3G8D7_9BACT|nr:hypothetical protein [Persicitalea jodogahamensis]GHB58107.1 hypothetical protein GCM10007390_09470 [Persicitalea jodogahamensis]
MKKISTIYLLSAIVLLGSCAREYPTFNQMPTNASYSKKASAVEQPTAVEKAEVEVAVAEQPAAKAPKIEELSANPEVVKMLAENSPKQIDEQLERALATTEGKALMAKPLVAAQINKARKMIAQNELRNSPMSTVEASKASKLVNNTLKKQMEKSTLAPASEKAAKALNNKIRIGLILVLVGLLLYLIPGLGYAVGSIVTVIGLVFIVLGLLDNV